MKALFIALKAEYYDAFVTGEKFVEYRLDGPRWNERTCIPRRPVILSRGYGKKHRLLGEILSSWAEPGDGLPDPKPFQGIYGIGKMARCIAIEVWD